MLERGLHSSLGAYASQIVKNGGAVVSGNCYRDGLENPSATMELLYFYESSILRGWRCDLGPADASVDYKVGIMLDRLPELDYSG